MDNSIPAIGMFDRRINRVGFLLGHLYLWLSLIACVGIASIADVTKDTSWEMAGNVVGFAAGLVGILVALMIIPVTFSLGVRRLHDLGRSWMYLLLVFIPIANLLVELYLLFAPGESESNQYGPPVRDNRPLVALGPQKPASH